MLCLPYKVSCLGNFFLCAHMAILKIKYTFMDKVEIIKLTVNAYSDRFRTPF